MENQRIRRTILLDRSGDDSKYKEIFYSGLALRNWRSRKFRDENEKLKRALHREHIRTVTPIIEYYGIDDSDKRLRVYAYRSGCCHIENIDVAETSHSIQVSIKDTNEKADWKLGEIDFAAKVYLGDRNDLVNVVEDVVMDIQMFYVYSYDDHCLDVEARRMFSKEKIDFVIENGLTSYWGDVKDSKYISLASVCRNRDGINYEDYVNLWERFNKWFDDRNKKDTHLESNMGNVAKNLLNNHPGRNQISMKRFRRLLSEVSLGRYYLIKTERKPKYKKTRVEIESRFGMKKWKNGRLKIVPISDRYTWTRLIPYVSMFEFDYSDTTEGNNLRNE